MSRSSRRFPFFLPGNLAPLAGGACTVALTGAVPDMPGWVAAWLLPLTFIGASFAAWVGINWWARGRG